MARTRSWYRTNQQSEYLISGSPVVLNLGSFTEGQTLTRTRLELQLANFWGSGLGAVVMAPYMAVQTVVALAFSQDTGGGAPPAGYFDVEADWIWVQQINWYNWPILIDPTVSGWTNGYQNTAESESIDSHSQRLVAPGNGGTLYAVFDAYNFNPDLSDGFQYYIQLSSSVLTLEPV